MDKQGVTIANSYPEVLLTVSPQSVVLSLAAMFTDVGVIIGGGFGIVKRSYYR